MRKTLASVAIAICMIFGFVGQVSGQSDFSAWFKVHNGHTTIIPWYVYSEKGGLFVDTRYNFDALKSGAVFVGKSWDSDSGATFTPAIGGIAGNYRSLSPELNISGKIGEFSFFSLNQYSFGLAGDYDFAYHWVDVLHPVGDNENVLVGIDEQAYWESSPGTKIDFDIGPVAKFFFLNRHSYIKLWYAFNNQGPNKVFIGVGILQ